MQSEQALPPLRGSRLFSILTRPSRAGLTSLPPLRGWCDRFPNFIAIGKLV
jgi:hypothetical protein